MTDDNDPWPAIQGEVPAIDLSAWLAGDVQPDRATLEDRSIPRYPGGRYPVPPYADHFPTNPQAYTLADVNAMRRGVDYQRRLDNARRAQPGYPRECTIPRPRPTVFDRPRITGDMVLYLLAITALAAIAGFIIIRAGR